MATWNDPSPLANPFSKRVYGNFNVDRANRGGYINHQRGAKSLQVPNQDIPPNGSPEWYAMLRRNRLEVPNQDVPPGDAVGRCACGRFLNDRLFALSDGTVLDYKTGRVVRTKNAPCCGKLRHELEYDTARSSWSSFSGPSIDEMVADMDRYVSTAVPGGYVEQMDPKSAVYWLKAQEETEKLVASMTDEQKAMVAQFEAHFPKSRLIEESKMVSPGSKQQA